jgi:hypothetical protein
MIEKKLVVAVFLIKKFNSFFSNKSCNRVLSPNLINSIPTAWDFNLLSEVLTQNSSEKVR